MTTYSYKDGRVWLQLKKFETYEPFLLSGLTDLVVPKGTLNVVREPSEVRRRDSVIVDILRSEPDLPSFRIETRLKKTLNYMLGLNRAVNYQCHMGRCDRPDDYYRSDIGALWGECMGGDVGVDRLAIVQGDNAPGAVSVPWSAKYGPVFHDFRNEFLSARTITEFEAVVDMVFLDDERFEDCQSQEDVGENGYASTEVSVGSPVSEADLWYTEDKGESWNVVSANPFGTGEDITCVVVKGTKNDHRVLVCRGTTDAVNPAEIAYADVTTFGTVTWTTVDVGAVDGQYILYMYWDNWTRLYVVTNDGYVYKSSDGGATWSAVLTTAVNQLNDIVAWRDGVVWVVGNSGTLEKSLDFGASWTSITPPAGWTGYNTTTITLCPDGTIIIGNSNGDIAGSYDDGVSWTLLYAQGITPTNIVRVRMYNSSLIYLVADIAGDTSRVVKSTDGGATFRLWNLNLPTNNGLEALYVVDQDVVFVGGQPVLASAFISRTQTQIFGL